MDVSKLKDKPKERKEIITLSKPEEKIDEILYFINKEINRGNQIFWICPLKKSQMLPIPLVIDHFAFLKP